MHRATVALSVVLVLAAPVLAACGGSDDASAPSATASNESYRQAFCGARTSFISLARTMSTRGSAPLNQADLTSDKQSRLAFVDDLVHGADGIVKALTAAGVPDVSGGQAGAEATVAVYRAVEDAYAAARKDFEGSATGTRADYLAAVKKLQKALVDAANTMGSAAGAEQAKIDPAFNAILHCP